MKLIFDLKNETGPSYFFFYSEFPTIVELFNFWQ